MGKGYVATVGVCFVVCGFGCGGTASNGSGANCQAVAPCGGDVTGTWKITSVCQQPQSADLGDGGSCPGQMLQVSLVGLDGTVTFGGGSFTSAITGGAASEMLTEPTSCFGANTSVLSCDQLSTALMESDAGTTGSCAVSGSNCICNGTVTVQPTTSSGTYTISGTSLSLTLANSTTGPQSDGYCVQGNTLYLDASAASSMTGTQQLSGLVLTKQ